MSYATMSKRALRSVREATAYELDAITEEHAVILSFLRGRLEIIDEILTRRMQHERTHSKSGERVHTGGKLPDARSAGDDQRSPNTPANKESVPDKGDSGGRSGGVTLKDMC